MTDRAKPMNNAGKPAKNIPLTRVDDNLKNFQPHDNRGDSGGVESDRAKEVEAIKQKLAAIEHERWSDWQSWCHKILRENCPSAELEKVLQRWDKQIATAYPLLSAAEQASDMEQVDRYWPLIEEYVRRAEVEAAVKVLEQQLSLTGHSALTRRNMHDRINELRGEQ